MKPFQPRKGKWTILWREAQKAKQILETNDDPHLVLSEFFRTIVDHQSEKKVEYRLLQDTFKTLGQKDEDLKSDS